MSFAYPILIALGPLLWLGALARLPRSSRIFHGNISSLRTVPRSLRLRMRAPILSLLSLVALFCLTMAAARPQRIEIIQQPKEARNIMLALDLSRSMTAVDFIRNKRRISRFEGVQSVVAEFLEQRHQDRMGLVVFGANAYVQSPLTLDHSLIAGMVRSLRVGIAGDGTAIGDGLGLSIKRIAEVEANTKAIVLLTDGVNNSGSVNPLKAAKVARDLGIIVHTIGIGSGSDQSSNAQSRRSNTSHQTPEFDEALLQEVATLTGGRYFNANSVEQLAEIYDEIDQLGKTNSDAPDQQIIEELFSYFLIAALLLYFSYLFAARTVFLKVP